MTVQYTNYDPVTGAIHQSGICPNMDCLPVGPQGSAWLYDKWTKDVETNRVNVTTLALVPYTSPTATTSTSALVNAERDRRIAAGFVFPPKPDPLAKLFQVNIPNISAAMSSATAATINGSQDGDLRWYDPNTDFGWIAMDNSILTMDARTMIMFGQTATAFNSSFYTAARSIKNRILAGETLVITDNALWPTAQTV